MENLDDELLIREILDNNPRLRILKRQIREIKEGNNINKELLTDLTTEYDELMGDKLSQMKAWLLSPPKNLSFSKPSDEDIRLFKEQQGGIYQHTDS